MRIRTASAAACLSIVLLGACLAQQPGPKDGLEVEKLRALARLRAEVELLEMEHRTDVNSTRNSLPVLQGDLAKAMGVEAAEDWMMTNRGMGIPVGEHPERSEPQKTQAAIIRLRTRFFDATVRLNEKKLELVELEKRLHNALGK